ncbi:MAG: biotin/lipoyl-containing protein [Anaerolineae bacterium]
MLNYCVSIGEREYQVKVNGTHLSLNGKPVQFDLASLNGNGLHVLRRGNQSIELYLSAQQRGVYEVLVGGRRVIAHVDPAHRRAHRRANTIAAGDLIAPMPGVVIQVLTTEGDMVAQDQVLVVLESMKMQMQVRAPFDGRVERLNATEGAAVEKGTLLARVTNCEL